MGDETAARDRRIRLIIYALLAIFIAFGLLFPSILKSAVSIEALEAYRLVDLAAGGRYVVIVADAAPGEGQRQAAALIRQTISSGAIVVTASLTQAGAPELDRLLRSQLAASRRIYGQAAINLGWRPGGMEYVDSLARGFAYAAQGRDHSGEDLEALPLTHTFRALDEAKLFVLVTSAGGGTVRAAQSIASAAAVQVLLAVSGEEATEAATQLRQEGRADAIIAGSRATGDYESLVAGRGSPSRYLTALTLGTLFVMVIIIWAFISGPISRRRQRAWSGGTE